MFRPIATRTLMAGVLAVMTALAAPNVAVAQHLIEFEPGVACQFGLGIDVTGGGEHRPFRQFTDRDGQPVMIIEAGEGFGLLLTNMTTGATLDLPPNGATSRTVFNPDGSRTTYATGHQLLILFPTDMPPGPSTTLYVGRLVFTILPTPTGDIFTLDEASGIQRDLCAELS